MVEARSLRTIAAPLQKEMNDRATVVATTTFAVVEPLASGFEFNKCVELPFVILRSLERCQLLKPGSPGGLSRHFAHEVTKPTSWEAALGIFCLRLTRRTTTLLLMPVQKR